MHNANYYKSSKYAMNLEAQREQARGALRFVARVIRYQKKGGRHIFGENPVSSAAWKEPTLVRAVKDTDLAATTVDMCAFGMKHPVTHAWKH